MDSPILAEYFRRENPGPTPPCDAISAAMAGLGGESEDFRRGKPRAYATSVSAGWGGGGGGPNISEGENSGPTPPGHQLVGRGE